MIGNVEQIRQGLQSRHFVNQVGRDVLLVKLEPSTHTETLIPAVGPRHGCWRPAGGRARECYPATGLFADEAARHFVERSSESTNRTNRIASSSLGRDPAATVQASPDSVGAFSGSGMDWRVAKRRSDRYQRCGHRTHAWVRLRGEFERKVAPPGR